MPGIGVYFGHSIKRCPVSWENTWCHQHKEMLYLSHTNSFKAFSTSGFSCGPGSDLHKSAENESRGKKLTLPLKKWYRLHLLPCVASTVVSVIKAAAGNRWCIIFDFCWTEARQWTLRQVKKILLIEGFIKYLYQCFIQKWLKFSSSHLFFCRNFCLCIWTHTHD